MMVSHTGKAIPFCYALTPWGHRRPLSCQADNGCRRGLGRAPVASKPSMCTRRMSLPEVRRPRRATKALLADEREKSDEKCYI